MYWGYSGEMKHKIAVYGNGWNLEALQQTLEGVKRYAELEDFDTFVFLSYASYSVHTTLNQGQLNLYQLGDLSSFDGIIVLSATLNSPPTAIELCRKAKDLGVPVVSIGMDIDDIPSIRVRNRDGMEALVTHLVEEHHVKHVVFMGGTPDHVDSIERLEITREVLAAHGITLEPGDICYGNWNNADPSYLIREMVSTNPSLPDAIICANDVMALSVSSELLRLGYSLPEDVIVTGYDHGSEGTTFYPSLCTVSPNFQKVGYRSCEMLFDQILEKPIETRLSLPSVFVPGESCRCSGGRDYVKIRQEFCQTSYHKHLQFNILEQRERLLAMRITGLTDYPSLKPVLSKHYAADHSCEGDSFAIVLCPDYFENPLTPSAEIFDINDPFRFPMDVVVSWLNGKEVQDAHLHGRELIPGYQKAPGEQHIYYFCALHNYEYDYGYIIFADDAYVLDSSNLFSYLEKVQQSLMQLRSNLRLDMLNQDLKRIYDKDPMTGLYTRFVYENKVDPIFETCTRLKQTMTVMFVDINYMKRINDHYGHLQGDIAIRIVANAIRDNIQPDWIGVRFGGDEFLIIAPDSGEETAADLKERLLGILEENNSTSGRPYKITVSCAYVVTNPSSGKMLEDYVREADQLMYRIKQEVHAKDGQPRS